MQRSYIGVLATASVTAVAIFVRVAPACAQAGWPSPDALQAALTDLLAPLTGGRVAPPDHPPRVARDGDVYRIVLPLPGLSTPANAAADAVARPLDNGLWEISSVVLPRAGTLPLAPGGGGSLSFSIGQQTIHATLDPGLVVASPFVAELHDVSLTSEAGSRRTSQRIERYTLEGWVSGETRVPGDTGQRLDLQSQTAATGWRIEARDKTGPASSTLIRSAAGSLNVEGLDSAQAIRLSDASQALAAALHATREQPADTAERPASRGRADGNAIPLPPSVRVQLRAVVDAFPGLMTRFEGEESLQQVHFDAAGGNRGDIGQVHVGLTGEARDNRLAARFKVTADDLTLGTLPPGLAAFVPRQIDISPAVSGMRIDRLLHFLRDTTAADADQTALQQEAMALLGDPDARIGIDSLAFSSGPLRVTGSGQVVNIPGGDVGFDLQLAATGLPALITEAQGNPLLRPALPLLLMAKGMGRAAGDRLVWDIALREGATTVNGLAVGLPPP